MKSAFRVIIQLFFLVWTLHCKYIVTETFSRRLWRLFTPWFSCRRKYEFIRCFYQLVSLFFSTIFHSLSSSLKMKQTSNWSTNSVLIMTTRSLYRQKISEAICFFDCNSNKICQEFWRHLAMILEKFRYRCLNLTVRILVRKADHMHWNSSLLWKVDGFSYNIKKY